MPTQYATTVHARLKSAAASAGIHCALIDSIDPSDMVVALMMRLCKASGASYAEVFSTRDAAD